MTRLFPWLVNLLINSINCFVEVWREVDGADDDWEGVLEEGGGQVQLLHERIITSNNVVLILMYNYVNSKLVTKTWGILILNASGRNLVIEMR